MKEPDDNMVKSNFDAFMRAHLSDVEPLMRAVNEAYWQASISGSQEDSLRFADLQLELQKIYRDHAEFEKVSSWKDSGTVGDPLDRRQLQLLYYEYARNQVDPDLSKAIVRLAASIENQFNVFRGQIDGKEITNNDIAEILKESDDPLLRQKAWETSKDAGTQIAGQLLELVSLRNEAARSIGFDNYYALSLEMNEQKEDQLVRLFDQLERLTAEPFQEMKRKTDRILAAKYALPESALEPWHYDDPFFQKAPNVSSIDLDGYYRHLDILNLVSNFYGSIGFEVKDIIEQSDLFEKPGKEQHAYCIDIDRRGDIRILANIKNDESWTGTMLHELGHAVYDKYIDPELPFLLRQAAHTFTTEAIAMLFGRLSKNASWIQLASGISDAVRESIAEEISEQLRFSQLIFVRWCQVMFHFERELYRNPHINLNEYWWQLVNRYQFLHIPDRAGAADWAAKIHIASVPVYYHNYLLGELLASQLHDYMQRRIIPSPGKDSVYNGIPAVGEYLKENVFAAGARYRWDILIERATGEALTPLYFIKQFI